MQRFEHDMMSIRSRWQGRHGVWLIDTPPRMVSLTTDSPPCNATVITIVWPSVSESVLRVKLGVTVFCILALPRVTLGITARRLTTVTVYLHLQYTINYTRIITKQRHNLQSTWHKMAWHECNFPAQRVGRCCSHGKINHSCLLRSYVQFLHRQRTLYDRRQKDPEK